MPAIDIDSIQSKVQGFQTRTLAKVQDLQTPAVEKVSRVAEKIASRLPENRPEAVVSGLGFQVDFIKQALDTRAAFTKAVLDAATKPLLPAPVKKRSVKAA